MSLLLRDNRRTVESGRSSTARPRIICSVRAFFYNYLGLSAP